MKKFALFYILFISLVSCSSVTKEEAVAYYLNIKYEVSWDTFTQIDNQKSELHEFMSNPARLTAGPDSMHYRVLITNQENLISSLKNCLDQLSKIKPLGDNSQYLEKVGQFIKSRLELDEGTMLGFVKRLEDGMTPEESRFLDDKLDGLLETQELQKKMHEADDSFLKEFNISEEEIEAGLKSLGY